MVSLLSNGNDHSIKTFPKLFARLYAFRQPPNRSWSSYSFAIADVVGITEGSVTLSKRRVRLAPSLGQGVHQVGSVEAPFGHDFSFADPMTPIDGFDDDSDQIDGDEVLLIEGCIAWLRKTPGVSVEFVNIDNGNTKHR